MNALLLSVALSFVSQQPSGDAVIRGKAGKSEIVIRTTTRLAGAIHSLTWDGVEFVDSADHGRQIQSAASQTPTLRLISPRRPGLAPYTRITESS